MSGNAGRRIHCCALRARRRSFRRVREAGVMPPLRLAVDARVIAEDTRGIGRYARADPAAPRSPRRPRAYAARRRVLSRAPARRVRTRAGQRELPRARTRVRMTPISSGIPPTAPSSRRAFPASPRSTMPCRFAIPTADPKRREHAQRPFFARHATATRVIAVSRFGRDEAARDARRFRWSASRSFRTASNPRFRPAMPQPLPLSLQGRRFLLFVGDPIGEPRKNFDLLYEAYRQAWRALRWAAARRRRAARAGVAGRTTRRQPRRRS